MCNCDSNDHIYRDGYITRCSFEDNVIKLFDSPINGEVIFTTCCDNIFEVYLFPPANSPQVAAEVEKPKNIIDVATMVEQRRNLLRQYMLRSAGCRKYPGIIGYYKNSGIFTAGIFYMI